VTNEQREREPQQLSAVKTFNSTVAVTTNYCVVVVEGKVYRIFSGFELMVDSDIILIKVEKCGGRHAKSVSFYLEIPRFVISATRVLDLGKALRDSEFYRHSCC
jgi:hypothetical protein